MRQETQRKLEDVAEKLGVELTIIKKSELTNEMFEKISQDPHTAVIVVQDPKLRNPISKNGRETVCPCGCDEFYVSYDFKTAVCRRCGRVDGKDEYRKDILDGHGWTREQK